MHQNMIRLKICYELRNYSKIRNRKYRAQVYFLKFVCIYLLYFQPLKLSVDITQTLWSLRYN